MGRRILAVIALVLLLASGCAETKFFAVNVGKGDALFILKDDYVAMIDTGRKKAKDSILAAMEEMDIDHIDDLFITHGDRDHTGGRKWLEKSGIEITNIYTSAHADVENALRLNPGDVISASGGSFTVLGPADEYPDEDDNSLVMRYDSSDGSILLAGDMELPAEEALLRSGADLACDVLKVPNHGDGDACGDGLIAACKPRIAVISTSTEEKADTPDPALAEKLESVCGVYVTQDSELGILTVLEDGKIAVTIK